jgi:hypothetical protein
MCADEDWSSLVPPSIAELVDRFDGVNRLKALAKTDKKKS